MSDELGPLLDALLDELAERLAPRLVPAPQPPAAEPEPWRLVDLEEAARLLTRSPRWLRERVKRGELPQVRLDGSALAFDVDDLRAFARSRRVGPQLSELGHPAAGLRAVEQGWWRS